MLIIENMVELKTNALGLPDATLQIHEFKKKGHLEEIGWSCGISP